MSAVKRNFGNLFFDRYFWAVASVILIAALLRLFLISGFDYYSDSYFFELTAKFIKEHFSLDGYLGASGEYYQPLFYKFGYSIWIALADLVFNNLEFSSHLVSLLFGIISLPLFWLFVKSFQKRTKLVALFLFGFSFTGVMLSGFILSETAALFFLLLTLVLFQGKKFFWAGPAFGVAVATRLEFALLLLPFFIWARQDKNLKRFGLFVLSSVGFYITLLGIFVWRAQNLAEMLTFWGNVIQRNFLAYLPYIIFGAILIAAVFFAIKRKNLWAIILATLALAGGVATWVFLKGAIPNLSGFWAFLQKDWLLAFGFL